MQPSRLGKLALVTLGIGFVVAGLVVGGSYRFMRSGYKPGQPTGADEGTLPSREPQVTFDASETNQTVATSAEQVERPEGAYRSRTEAIELARETARAAGSDLANYEEPRACFHTDTRWNYWSVFFDGKSGVFGDHFSVRVDDLTGATRLVKGR
jgi:hypothetical protein